MEDIPRDVIEQAQSGNRQAFEKIYRAASGFVYSVSLRITNSSEEAEEVTQDVFLKIYHHLKDFQFRSSFKTWAYRIAVNTSLNRYKRTSKEMNRREDFDTVAATQEAAQDPESDPALREERQVREAKLRSLLTALNPDQRTCIVLREIQGLSYQEISRVLKININTVRSRLKRARQALLGVSGGGLSHEM